MTGHKKPTQLDQHALAADIRQLTRKATGLLSQMNQQLQKLRDKHQRAADEATSIRVRLAAAAEADELAAVPSALQQQQQHEGYVAMSGDSCSADSSSSREPAPAVAAAAADGLARQASGRCWPNFASGEDGSQPPSKTSIEHPSEASGVLSCAGDRHLPGSVDSEQAGGRACSDNGASADADVDKIAAVDRQDCFIELSTGSCIASGEDSSQGSSLDIIPGGTVGVGQGGAVEISKAVALMSPYIWREVQNGYGLPDNPPVTLPKQVSESAWEMILEYCEFHVVPGRSDKERRAFDERFVKNRDTSQLCDITSGADGLEMRTLVDLASHALARVIRGKNAEQIREAFSLPDDLTEEEKLEPIALAAGGALLNDPRVRMLNRLYAKRRLELQQRKVLQAQLQQQLQKWDVVQGGNCSSSSSSAAAAEGSRSVAGSHTTALAATGEDIVLTMPRQQAEDQRSVEELLQFIESGMAANGGSVVAGSAADAGGGSSGSKSKKKKKKAKQQAAPAKEQQQQQQGKQEDSVVQQQRQQEEQRGAAEQPPGTPSAEHEGDNAASPPDTLGSRAAVPDMLDMQQQQQQQHGGKMIGPQQALLQEEQQQQEVALSKLPKREQQYQQQHVGLSTQQLEQQQQQQQQQEALPTPAPAQPSAEGRLRQLLGSAACECSQQQQLQELKGQPDGQSDGQQQEQRRRRQESQPVIPLSADLYADLAPGACGATPTALPPSCSRYLLPLRAGGALGDPPTPGSGLSCVSPGTAGGPNELSARRLLTYRPLSYLTSLARFQGASNVRWLPPQPNPSGKKPPLPMQQRKGSGPRKDGGGGDPPEGTSVLPDGNDSAGSTAGSGSGSTSNTASGRSSGAASPASNAPGAGGASLAAAATAAAGASIAGKAEVAQPSKLQQEEDAKAAALTSRQQEAEEPEKQEAAAELAPVELSPGDVASVFDLLSAFLRTTGLNSHLKVVAAPEAQPLQDGPSTAAAAAAGTTAAGTAASAAAAITAASNLPCGARLELLWIPASQQH